MSLDLIVGVVAGAAVTLVVVLRALIWAVKAAGRLAIDWIVKALP